MTAGWPGNPRLGYRCAYIFDDGDRVLIPITGRPIAAFQILMIDDFCESASLLQKMSIRYGRTGAGGASGRDDAGNDDASRITLKT